LGLLTLGLLFDESGGIGLILLLGKLKQFLLWFRVILFNELKEFNCWFRFVDSMFFV
jgi:hypothetical protein